MWPWLQLQHSLIKTRMALIKSDKRVHLHKCEKAFFIWKVSFPIIITLNHIFCFTFADCDPDETLITPVSSTQGIPMCTSRKPAPQHWTTHRPADYISSASKSRCWACSLDLSTVQKQGLLVCVHKQWLVHTNNWRHYCPPSFLSLSQKVRLTLGLWTWGSIVIPSES